MRQEIPEKENQTNYYQDTDDSVPTRDYGMSQNGESSKQIFKIDLSTKNTIREKVICGRHEVEGVVDTAAAISVIDFEFLKETPFAMQPWKGPDVILINGSMEKPLGCARIYVKHKNGSASGLVLVMKMGGIHLLLGNDLL